MIEFSIDPLSGHSHSALDIRFTISGIESKIAQIEIFNITSDEQLEILSVSTGYIKNEKTVIVKNTKKVEGYINLFNKDKLNESLDKYVSVDLKCSILSDDESTELSAIFFNESQSLDAEIIPFDFVVDNSEIDLKRNVPLGMHVVCDTEQRFELCIRSENGKQICTFEVVTRKGRTSLLLPSEIIWSDLGLAQQNTQKFHIYWVKFEGINHMGSMNRKYIQIPNTRLTFNCSAMTPKPQLRNGPTGVPLSQDFVLSHRYYVHTWKPYTSLGSLPTAYSQQKMNNMTRFMHETQHVQSMKVITFGESSQSSEQELRQAIKKTIVRKQYKNMDPRQKIVVEAFARPYLLQFAALATDRHYVQTFATNKPQKGQQPRRKGCGCSRKHA